MAFTSAPSARTAIAGSSRPRTSSANAVATASATTRSLWPLETAWNSTTGFAPKATIAKAIRRGPDPADRVGDHEQGREAGHDRDRPVGGHLVGRAAEHLGDHRRGHRPERPVDRRRVDPLRAHEDPERVARELERRPDVGVRVVHARDPSVERVRVDVAREQQRQRGDRHEVDDRRARARCAPTHARGTPRGAAAGTRPPRTPRSRRRPRSASSPRARPGGGDRPATGTDPTAARRAAGPAGRAIRASRRTSRTARTPRRTSRSP